MGPKPILCRSPSSFAGSLGRRCPRFFCAEFLPPFVSCQSSRLLASSGEDKLPFILWASSPNCSDDTRHPVWRPFIWADNPNYPVRSPSTHHSLHQHSSARPHPLPYLHHALLHIGSTSTLTSAAYHFAAARHSLIHNISMHVCIFVQYQH